MRAITVTYINNKDQVKKILCLNLKQYENVFKYGVVQSVTDINGQLLNLLNVESYLKGEV